MVNLLVFEKVNDRNSKCVYKKNKGFCSLQARNLDGASVDNLTIFAKDIYFHVEKYIFSFLGGNLTIIGGQLTS
jgi:hypothetical protein